MKPVNFNALRPAISEFPRRRGLTPPANDCQNGSDLGFRRAVEPDKVYDYFIWETLNVCRVTVNAQNLKRKFRYSDPGRAATETGQ